MFHFILPLLIQSQPAPSSIYLIAEILLWPVFSAMNGLDLTLKRNWIEQDQ